MTPRDFPVESVCWGYRDLFTRAIQELHDTGLLGGHRMEATRTFYRALSEARQEGYDHVIKEFLVALTGPNRWVLDVPRLFQDVTQLGLWLSKRKIHYGMTFFRALGAGDLGESPEELETFLETARRVMVQDVDLAFALMRGYRVLKDRLTKEEIHRFATQGLAVYERNAQAAVGFFACELKSSHALIQTIAAEARLPDMERRIRALVKGLSGHSIGVEPVNALDSDELIMRGSRCVCFHTAVYLPTSVRVAADKGTNEAWYLLAGVTAAGLFAAKSFPLLHGHPDYSSCESLVGPGDDSAALFQMVEYLRALDGVRRRWPGAVGLVRSGLTRDRESRRDLLTSEELFFRLALDEGTGGRVGARVLAMVRESATVFETAEAVRDALRGNGDLAGVVGGGLFRGPDFFPDFGFEAVLSNPPPESLVADLKSPRNAAPQQDTEGDSDEQAEAPGDQESETDEDQAEEGTSAPAAFLYDEWCQAEDDYYRDFCQLREFRPEPAPQEAGAVVAGREVERVRRIFEALRPDEAARQKYLQEGDAINHEELVRFMVDRTRDPSPRTRFYERHELKRRDVSVLILIDLSGSTGERVEHERVIELEEQAALIFGEGLASLGDSFSVCGFNSNGPEDCRFYRLKDFDEPWGSLVIRRVRAVQALGSTRIGPALRHSGYLLHRRPSRRKLVLLITDGKPMDSDYSPETRHAQYDVRKACQENRQSGIITFALSTEENTVADMDLMFPDRRYGILPDMRKLPDILPWMYLKLTV